VLLRELIPQRGVERKAPANATALSTGGKMGRYVLVVALLVGFSDSVFARDDGRYANRTEPLRSGGRLALHGYGWQRLHSMFPAWSRYINAPANRGHDTRAMRA
jgi:hypothetical protein